MNGRRIRRRTYVLTCVRLFYYPDGTFRTDVLTMVNPALTVAFQIFLVVAASVVIGSMIKEYMDGRAALVGRRRRVGMSAAETHPRAIAAPQLRVGSVNGRRRQTALRPSPAAHAGHLVRSRAKRRSMAQVI